MFYNVRKSKEFWCRLLDESLVSLLLSLPHSSDEEYTKQPQRTERSFEKSEVWCMLRLRDPSSTPKGSGTTHASIRKSWYSYVYPSGYAYRLFGLPLGTRNGSRGEMLDEDQNTNEPCPTLALFKRALSTTHHAFGYCLVTSYLAGIATVCSEREA